ncbi:hypothetical protein [Aquimarina pacifica]|uniref:hypothetical protein n=1 Tax=Aquimarina pacifica TaxID=1296415 RepID=UPI000471628D|nr:hypothetical protein [Aquimarina pacifica]
MGRVWLTDYPHISLDFEDLTIVTPRITNAYFAKKVVTGGAVPATTPTVAFDEINEGILGRDVYIIVETENFTPPNQSLISTERASLVVALKTGDCNLTGVADETLQITNGTTDVDSITVQVGDTTALNDIEGNCDYGNLDDFIDTAIIKVSLRPNARTDFDTWAENINNSGSDLPTIEIDVVPEDKNMIVDYGPEDNTQGPPLKIGRFMNSEGHEFTLENKNVYEIYHGDNLFNSLGTHTHNEEVVRRRISFIENDFSTEVKYFFYNLIDNCYEICECTQTRVRRRNNGQRITSTNFQSNYNNYTSSVAAPQGGDAETNYYYADGSIISYGQAYGYRRYALTSPNDPNDLVDLIRMPDDLNINFETGLNNVRATFSYRNTARRYCNPACFAGFIGVLIQLGRTDVVCTGMCFGDATSYPSVTHPNGDSVDTAYLSTLAIEQLKVDAFRDYYFTNILRGNISWYPQLTDTAYSNGHNDHLHSGDFNLERVVTIN